MFPIMGTREVESVKVVVVILTSDVGGDVRGVRGLYSVQAF